MVNDVFVVVAGAAASAVASVISLCQCIKNLLDPCPALSDAVSRLSFHPISVCRDHVLSRLEHVWGPGDGRPVEELKVAIDQVSQSALREKTCEIAGVSHEEFSSRWRGIAVVVVCDVLFHRVVTLKRAGMREESGTNSRRNPRAFTIRCR